MGRHKIVKRAVFLDRDGVINKALFKNGISHPPQNLQEFEYFSDAQKTCQELEKAGFILIVVTNQPDVARGTQTKEMCETIHQKIKKDLPVRAIFACYHDDQDACLCRKPKPGLLQEGAQQFGIDLKASFMVGDRWRDVEAGRSAGCKTVLIENPYSQAEKCTPDLKVKNLSEAGTWILAQGGSK
jgi:D-glycero-D-manno-heptose 1,7-bisphosphate phosphatase